MSVGESELIGDTDLIQQVDRQYTFKCTSLEGELILVKRDYFEDKVFKYQDTFSDLVKRCKNKQMNYDQNVQNIKQQLEIASNSVPQNTFPKKMRSFSNLIPETSGNDRRQSQSPFQDKIKQFEYHKKTKLHVNIQNKMEISLPQIQNQYTYTPDIINIRSLPQSPNNYTPSISTSTKHKEQDNTFISQQFQNLKENNPTSLQNYGQFTNSSNLKNDTLEKKEIENQYFTPRNSQQLQNQQQPIFENTQIKSSINRYEDEFQIKNNYYEPSSLPCTRRNRETDNQRSQDVSFDNQKNSSILQRQSQISESPNNSRNQTFGNALNKLKELNLYSPNFIQESSNNEAVSFSKRNKFIQNTSTNEDINKSYIQNSDIDCRSISQKDFHSIHDRTNHQIGFYNNKPKKIVKIKHQNSKEINYVQSKQSKVDDNKKIQSENSEVILDESKQLTIPDLNLNKQNTKVSQFKTFSSQSPKNNKLNGSHTERISSIKNNDEKDFMDSSYGYFKMREQVAKEILTERNTHKPLLMEIKPNEQIRNEITKKKALSYHQQQMSSQERILQTLIFSKKKVKNHFFSKLMGNSFIDVNNQQDCLKNFKTSHSGEKQLKQNNIEQPSNKNNQNKLNGQNYKFIKRSFDLQNTATNQINKFKNNEQSITETNSASKNLIGNPINSEQQLQSSLIRDPEQYSQDISKISGQNQEQVFSLETKQNETQKEHDSKNIQEEKNININSMRNQEYNHVIEQQSQRQPTGYQMNTYSVLKNNLTIFPEINNFHIDQESKFIFESYQFLDPLRESQKYKVGSSSIQNRLFRKTKKKMQNTRLKIQQLSQNTFEN